MSFVSLSNSAVPVSFYFSESKYNFNLITNYSLRSSVCFGVVVFIFLIIYRCYRESIFNIEVIMLMSSVFIGLLLSYYEHFSAFLRVSRNTEKVIFYRLAKVGLEVSVLLCLLYFLNDWKLKLYSLGISLFFICSLYLYFNKSNFKYNLSYGINLKKKYLSFFIPMTLHSLSGWVMYGADKIFLKGLSGKLDLGEYSMMYTLSMSVSLLAISLNQSLSPFFLSFLKERKKLDRKAIRLIFVTSVVFVSISMFVYFILINVVEYFIDYEFLNGLEYLYLLFLSQVLGGLYYITSNIIIFFKKFKYYTYITLSSAVINLVLNYCLIEDYGAYGASVSTCISYVFSFIVSIGFAYMAIRGSDESCRR